MKYLLITLFILSGIFSKQLAAQPYIIKSLKDSSINSRNSKAWNNANSLKIEYFLPESKKFKPETTVRMLYDQNKLYVLFIVKDKYVIANARKHFDEIFYDSTIEFFFSTRDKKLHDEDWEYFNFEINCTGKAVVRYNIMNVKGKRYKIKNFTLAEIKELNIKSSLPYKTISNEIKKNVKWQLYFEIPLEIIKKYSPKSLFKKGTAWRANFYKCAVKNSQPHYASWQYIKKLNFHCPEFFGEIKFE